MNVCEVGDGMLFTDGECYFGLEQKGSLLTDW